MPSSAEPETRPKKQEKGEAEDVADDDDDDDEETRLRDRLLARRAKQLKEQLAAEPDDDGTASRLATSKKSHHHHHKKKKRRRGSDDEEEDEVKPTERLSSVASSVSSMPRTTDTLDEEEGLNIRPPQTTVSADHKRYGKRGRDERSPDYRTERTQNRYRQENYDADQARRERVDEGWTSWRKSLNRPWSHHSRGGGAPPMHSASERGRSPPLKSDSRLRYRSRDRSSPPPSSRWLPSKASATTERMHTSRHQQIGRVDKVKNEGRGSVESKSKYVRSHVEDSRTKSRVETTANTSNLAVLSPEATPTMDEMEDLDVKPAAASPHRESRERKRSSSGREKEHSPQLDHSPASNLSPSGSVGQRKSGASSSSMESGEHRSDDEVRDRKRPYEGGEVEVKRVKYSKFESSPSSSESGGEEDTRIAPQDISSDGEGDEEAHADHTDATLTEAAAGQDDLLQEVSPEPEFEEPLLPVYYPALMGCRSVEEFHSLNRIEEGTYGVVYRAKEKRTDEIVALKRLKMEKEKEGFPITSLREINMLLKAGNHRNIVKVREIVVGSNMDKIYLVMDYVEHDLKSLMESMKHPFLIGEVKTLLRQLLEGIKHLHENWILHRDLKTSNLLLSHRGVLKIADFGLAREYGDPLKPYTPVVVTLWYRAPELLLGIKKYSTPIDMWSVGCIFAEILTLKPFFTGKSEIEQLSRIFKVLGTPNDQIWPGFGELPGVKLVESFAPVKYNSLRKCFGATLSDNGFSLLNRFLTYDPEKRITAGGGLEHEWFMEEPRPVKEEMFPTWPAKSEQSKAPRKGAASPKPPSGGKQFLQAVESDKDYLANLKRRAGGAAAAAPGFSLKFDAPKF